MGILNLNKLFEKCFTEDYGKHYDVIIVDGSNIIFQTLCRETGNLKKSGIVIQQWDSFNMDILTQISYILRYAIQDIKDRLLKYFTYNPNCEMILVLDPVESPKYRINDTYNYNHTYSDILHTDIKEGTNIDFEIKSEEQETRRARASKTETKESFINEINTLDGLTHEQQQILAAIFQQSFTFKEVRELLRMGDYVIHEVYRQLSDYNFKIIKAIDEADLVIKNIASQYPEDKQILVLSMDTDYNVLFGFNQNVDTCSLMSHNTYNPFKCWNALFKGSPAFDYDHVVRLAPLFGNDYTVKESLVNAVNFNDVLKLYEGDFEDLVADTNRKKITKFIKYITLEARDKIRYDENGLLSLDSLDDMLFKWNPNYFKKYMLSNIIYTNWQMFNHYTELPKPDEYDCLAIFETFMKSFIEDKLKIKDSNDSNENSKDSDTNNDETNESTNISNNDKTNESTNISNNNDKTNDKTNNDAKSTQKVFKLYKWDGSLIFNDWDKFFQTLEVIEFDCPDMFIDYYYEHEYHDDAEEFMDDD